MSTRAEALESLERLRAVVGNDFRDPSVRRVFDAAVETLADLPASDTVFLVELLAVNYAKARERHHEFIVCSPICLVLGRRRAREAVPILCQILVDPNADSIREDVAAILGDTGDVIGVPFLVRVLSHCEVWVRAKAALSLGRLGDPQVVPSVIPLLEDEAATVREAAVEARAALGGREACAALIRTLQVDDEPTVRAAAAEALAECEGDEATEALERAVAQEADEDVVCAARESLHQR